MEERIKAAVILGGFVLAFVASGVYMLKGNGWSMINMPEKAKAKWDKRALCRFVGGFMLYIALCFLLILAAVLLDPQKTSAIAIMSLMLGGSAVAIIKMFFPNESQKVKQDENH